MTAPMVCVPVEPTEAMIQVGYEAMRTNNLRDTSEQGRVRRIFAAMLAAAPAPPQAVQGEAAVGDGLLREVCAELTGLECGPSIGSMAPWEDLHGRIVQYLANNPTPAMPIAASGDVEQRARELLPTPYKREKYATAKNSQAIRDGYEMGGYLLHENLYQESDVLNAISAALRSQGQAVADSERMDYIERTFSGMTNRERYLPVQMIWGKGCNGRTLREACDKYRKRDAALAQQANKDAPKASA